MDATTQDDRALRRIGVVSGHLGGINGGNQPVSSEYKFVRVRREGRVAVVTLNRPRALNALCDALIRDLSGALRSLDADEGVSAIVLTGAGRAFAAGADIKEMKDKNFYGALTRDHIKAWEVVAGVRIPVIAAVNGYALGGGCEVAMMCDVILASERAKFGQPEITIGTIPGAGATQRLTRAVGKSKAMELILGGGMVTATEALQSGLVSSVHSPETLMPAALKLAKRIASMSRPVLMLAKKAVLVSFNTPLDTGLQVERQLFQSTFALRDQTEGMKAFADKRKPRFENR